ncbi:MAG: hypothetical protein JF628_13150, partial [Sphingomonas sp.]|nr:hypothetical protein [Sphingomonas sp.]
MSVANHPIDQTNSHDLPARMFGRMPPADRIMVWIVTLATAILHLAVGGRYDMMRNELYFLACGHHPAFGYADQPPLVPLIAASTQLFGENVWL